MRVLVFGNVSEARIVWKRCARAPRRRMGSQRIPVSVNERALRNPELLPRDFGDAE
jgi:hypothetical protein